MWCASIAMIMKCIYNQDREVHLQTWCASTAKMCIYNQDRELHLQPRSWTASTTKILNCIYNHDVHLQQRLWRASTKIIVMCIFKNYHNVHIPSIQPTMICIYNHLRDTHLQPWSRRASITMITTMCIKNHDEHLQSSSWCALCKIITSFFLNNNSLIMLMFAEWVWYFKGSRCFDVDVPL